MEGFQGRDNRLAGVELGGNGGFKVLYHGEREKVGLGLSLDVLRDFGETSHHVFNAELMLPPVLFTSSDAKASRSSRVLPRAMEPATAVA